MIEIRKVSKSYGETTVVDEADCVIAEGGITSIIGPNGAGKSTLLSMISRFESMSSGSITVGGLDVSQAPSRELARIMATLRQDNHLSLRVTVRDLVSFGRFPHHQGRPGAADREKVLEALDYLDLLSLQHRFLDELSGGQRQRAFVAMVLAQDTRYILLDEPLNNLDMKHSVEMMRRLRQISKDFGKTVVLVIHDINVAAAYSRQIIAMRAGRLIQHGSPEQIMRPEVLREIYEVDVAVHRVEGQLIGLYFH